MPIPFKWDDFSCSVFWRDIVLLLVVVGGVVGLPLLLLLGAHLEGVEAEAYGTPLQLLKDLSLPLVVVMVERCGCLNLQYLFQNSHLLLLCVLLLGAAQVQLKV